MGTCDTVADQHTELFLAKVHVVLEPAPATSSRAEAPGGVDGTLAAVGQRPDSQMVLVVAPEVSGSSALSEAEALSAAFRGAFLDFASGPLQELALSLESASSSDAVAEAMERGFRGLDDAAQGRVLSAASVELRVGSAGEAEGCRRALARRRRVAKWRPDDVELGRGCVRIFGSPVEWPDVSWHCHLCHVSLAKWRLRPRHHCRRCGRSVCGACSAAHADLEGWRGPQRVCSACAPPPPGPAPPPSPRRSCAPSLAPAPLGSRPPPRRATPVAVACADDGPTLPPEDQRQETRAQPLDSHAASSTRCQQAEDHAQPPAPTGGASEAVQSAFLSQAALLALDAPWERDGKAGAILLARLAVAVGSCCK